MTATHILEDLPLAVMAVDDTNLIQYLNPAAEEWLGLGARHAVGKPLASMMGDENFDALIERARAEAVSLSEFDRVLPMRGGRQALVDISLVRAPGQVILVFTPKQYTPAQREAESRDEVARASGLMAAMLAHEVKNPLAGIRGAAQLLQAEVGTEGQALAALICAEVDRISGVLARVEPFSETRPALVHVDAHETLAYVRRVAETGAARGIGLREELDTSLPEVLGARPSLIQILLNLVTNAAEAGAREITLITTSRQDFNIMGREGPIRPQAHIIVQDNGPGVPPELQTHLFEPFVSARGPGRGLGLPIAAKLAADMGGVLGLESTEKGKTRFRLTLKAV